MKRQAYECHAADKQTSNVASNHRISNRRISNHRIKNFNFVTQLPTRVREKILKHKNAYRRSLDKRAHHLVDKQKYIDRIEESLQNLTPKYFRHNLTREETKTLERLASNQDLVRDGLAHLSDQAIYREIDQDPTPQLSKAINRHVQERHHRPNHQRPPNLQRRGDATNTTALLSEKDTQRPRPIVSGCGGPIEKISQLLTSTYNHLSPR